MSICKVCGCVVDGDDMWLEGASIINKGLDSEHILCGPCLAEAHGSGKIIQCEACGENFTADVLHDEEIEGHSFTACPVCGMDMVEALGRTEFEDKYFCPKYSVVVRAFNGSCRGYIVSAKSRHEVMKRLLERLDFNGVAEVTIGEILLKDDEF